MLRSVTVIRELNCSAAFAQVKATLWIVKGDSTIDDEGPYPNEDPNAFRLVGPYDPEFVKELEPKVIELMKFLGFDVHSDFLTDD